jgi:hypothetical protein
LPENSSAAFDLMSWIGRGNVLTITVDMAPISGMILARAIRPSGFAPGGGSVDQL